MKNPKCFDVPTKETEMKEYHKTHVAAKTIVTAVVILLLLVAELYNLFIFQAISVVVWFWAVNPVASLIEKILHLRQKHDWL